ncbi:MAG: DUF1049 domain-containing protein [Alphaproteobacteria bacterium]|nr:DUF1049 domain-containing protein [Alphaproteobacteria bacterium]
MFKVLYWIVVLPLAVAIIVFSVNNRSEVTLDLWPLGVVTAPVPVFAVVLASILAGFLAGGFVAWNSAGRSRRRARAEARRADLAERDLKTAQERIEGLQKAAEIPASPQPHQISRFPPNAA